MKTSKINMRLESKGRTIGVTLAYFFLALGVIAGVVALVVSFIGI